MTTQYVDTTKLIDGPGEAFVLDQVTNALTHASTACTTTVLTMATDPRLKFRKGDVIKVTSTGTAFRRIKDLSATTITLETALPSAPGTGIAIYREWRLLGATQGGIEVRSQLTTQNRVVDQLLDPVIVKPESRETTVVLPLAEFDADNLVLALALPDTAKVVAGSKTTINVGATGNDLPTRTILVVGSDNALNAVYALFHKCTNRGQATIAMAKDRNGQLALELQVIFDSTKPTGKELFVYETDTAVDYGIHTTL